MATPNPLALTLVLATAVFMPRLAQAAEPETSTTAKPDPCKQPIPEDKTGEQILREIPPNDALWGAALEKRRIYKVKDEWLQYVPGGSFTATNKAFRAVLEVYCIDKMTAAKPKPLPVPVVERQVARPVAIEIKATEQAKIRSDKSSNVAKDLANRIKDMFKFTSDETPTPLTADECSSIRAQADTCRAAGIEVGKLDSEVICRNAVARAETCPR